MRDVEIEIQVRIEKTKPLEEFLDKNASFRFEVNQVDEYFSPQDEKDDFLKQDPITRWLRIRKEDKIYYLNFKKFYYEKTGENYFRDEFESKIEDPEEVRKIFLALNFKPIVVVEKLRKAWQCNEWEIALDDVKNVGQFVEIEFKFSQGQTDPKKDIKEMIEFLKKIGCGKLEINYQSYPFLVLFPDKAKFEEL